MRLSLSPRTRPSDSNSTPRLILEHSRFAIPLLFAMACSLPDSDSETSLSGGSEGGATFMESDSTSPEDETTTGDGGSLADAIPAETDSETDDPHATTQPEMTTVTSDDSSTTEMELETESTTDDTSTSFCGDGIKDEEEECDGQDLDGLTCKDFGKEYGFLNCFSNCTLNDQCFNPVCGDGSKHASEECDDGNLENHDGCDDQCKTEDNVVFVTSVSYSPNLPSAVDFLSDDSLGIADGFCQKLAEEAGLAENGDTFAAWLATSPENDPESRFKESDGPYYNACGDLIASNFSALLGGQLQSPLACDEMGNEVDTLYWTGLSPNGTHAENNCKGWKSTQANDLGIVGSSVVSDYQWSLANVKACDQGDLPIVCVSQNGK